ncbi:hypothetical protein [Salipiger mangrovisoli]|uniref:HupE / UreJ protein n=1 Tax=Salipiger mangrovisoli TaxID=2865933 RepID=A0ABR9X7J9_9RHOB|nr:hypothetical protein [Salipiger mangrovisoli]MBE9639401.1 hypothetical protein [Salipiger mangrovisoli]
MRSLALAVALALLPRIALAHEAFGDLGPFYGGLLHPVMAPLQTLVLAALAILLARQPLDGVRAAYPALVLAGAGAIVLHAAMPDLAVPMRLGAAAAVMLGGLALWGVALPRGVLVVLAMTGAALAAVSGDAAALTRAGLLGAVGSILGIAAFVLLVWGLVDILQSRLGRVSGAVAAAWLIAIGAMAAVLPG